MKKNIAKLVQMGVLVPALVLSMAACGTSGNSGTAKSDDTAPAEETTQEDPEGTEETTPADEGKEETAPADQEGAAKEAVVFENAGMKITLPAELADKITVETPEKDEDGAIFTAYETASVEADKAMGNENQGGGWLFAICTRTEEDVRLIMTSDEPGEEIIGHDDNGVYYVYYHPTDVRYVRETPEQMEQDQDQWTKATEWASSVYDTFAQDNAGITKMTWSNTMVESYLSRTCYQKDAKYEMGVSEDAMTAPGSVDSEKYFKLLTTDAKYERIDGMKAPEGEYVLLSFPEDDIRFYFYVGEENDGYIRQVWYNDENEEIYKVTFADSSKSAGEIMQQWYAEISENAGK